MTGPDVALIITACGTLLSALFGGIAVLISALNSRAIQKVHNLTNSKMDELLTVTKKSATAEGNLAGRAEQKADTLATIGKS